MSDPRLFKREHTCARCRKRKVPLKVDDCIYCQRLYRRAYRARLGREKVNAMNRAHYAKNKESVRQWRNKYIDSHRAEHNAKSRIYARVYYKKNHAKIRTQKRARYHAYASTPEGIEKRREGQRLYCSANKDKLRASARAWYRRTIESRRAWSKNDYAKHAEYYRQMATKLRYGKMASAARALFALEEELKLHRKQIKREREREKYRSQRTTA